MVIDSFIKEYLEITTTASCVNNCVYCPQKLYTKRFSSISRNRMMTFELFKRCIDKVPNKIVISFGGFSEPFLNPDCLKMILYAKKKGFKLQIFTTLVNLSLSDCAVLIKHLDLKHGEVDGISIHLASEEPIEHINITDDMKRILSPLLSSDINIDFHYHGKNLNNKYHDIPFISKAYHLPLNTRAGLIPLIKKRLPRKRGEIFCPTNFHTNILLPTGDVTVCCQDFGLQHRIGNLLYQDYPSLFKSEEIKKLKAGCDDDSIDILCRYCDWSLNKNAVAVLYNKPFNLLKVGLFIKICLYNKTPNIYRSLKTIYYFLKKQKISKDNSYLKWKIR